LLIVQSSNNAKKERVTSVLRPKKPSDAVQNKLSLVRFLIGLKNRHLFGGDSLEEELSAGMEGLSLSEGTIGDDSSASNDPSENFQGSIQQLSSLSSDAIAPHISADRSE